MYTKHLYAELIESLPDFKKLLENPCTRSPEVVWQLVANAFALAVALDDEALGHPDRIPEHIYDVSEPVKKQLRRFQQGEIVKFSSSNGQGALEDDWIPVTDRLPPLDVEVLCWCDGYRSVASLYPTTNGFEWTEGGHKHVTHWKPISLEEPTNHFD